MHSPCKIQVIPFGVHTNGKQNKRVPICVLKCTAEVELVFCVEIKLVCVFLFGWLQFK